MKKSCVVGFPAMVQPAVWKFTPPIDVSPALAVTLPGAVNPLSKMATPPLSMFPAGGPCGFQLLKVFQRLSPLAWVQAYRPGIG